MKRPVRPDSGGQRGQGGPHDQEHRAPGGERDSTEKEPHMDPNPKNRTNPDEPRDRHEDLPGLDPDKPQRSEQGTDHIEDPEHVAEHLSEIDRKDSGEEE
jgi:hypothetical protein